MRQEDEKKIASQDERNWSGRKNYEYFERERETRLDERQDKKTQTEKKRNNSQMSQ